MTVVIHFPLPAKPLTMNQRLHWAQKAKLTAAWRDGAHLAAHALAPANDFGGVKCGLLELPRSVVELTIPVRSVKIRRDPHNWFPTVKAVVDGLVDAGLWPDDTSEYVVTVEPRFKQGGDCEIRITPADEWVTQLRQRGSDHTYEHLPGCDDDGWDHRGPCIVDEAST